LAATNPMQVGPDLALFTALIFLCLLLVLWKFAWGPIMKGLATREEGIAANIDQAQQDAEAAAEKLQQYEEQLTAATEKARTIIAKAQEDAQAAADTIAAEAREAAQRQRDRALADIETAKNVALGEVAEKSVDIALGLAGNIVRRQLTAEEHSELIRETLDKFPSKN
ncbi:MAG TPA: F0F1 ATP synthase subunit B, partial [Planctomycetaceae bacterium]|nr:F0F1 ATP synthase subunit B [Planctomycetaceae bacterium]